ncbi:glycine/sarcosine/betaine reductase component B subunit, partial [Proteocatella sphenisci]
MKLEIGNFYVKDVRLGNETSYKDGILSIDKEA